jgi:threonine dehydratase
MIFPSASDLENAELRLAAHIHHTPVLTSKTLNRMTGAELFFKCENFQKMGAFKMRGALNAVMQLPENQKKKGVATHSSGNFGQALSLAAAMMNIRSWIVMPSTAPAVKKAAVRGYGAEIVECEPTLESREKTLQEVVKRTGAVFIHSSNNIDVITGNATSAMELIDETDHLDAIIAPVGGGGLLAGTALAARHFLQGCNVYAGEPSGADDAYRSFIAGEIQPLGNPVTIADGLRVALGDLNFPIIKAFVKDIILIEEDEIIQAMKLLWERMKIVIEPSSAVALAAVFKRKEEFAGKKTGVILSGGNVDLTKLPF